MICMLPASLVLVASSLAAAPQVDLPADSYRSLVDASQLAIEQGRFEDAIIAIDAAQAQRESPMAELVYNRAVANYRLANWQAAASDFTEAIALSDDQALLSNSVYNLGNVTHKQVVDSLQEGNEADAQQAIKNLEAAQEELGSALDHYRSAIEAQADDADARANAEMTWNLIKQLQQMQEQLEQQQDQQQQDQQQQNQDQQGDQQQQQQNQDQQGDQQQQDQQQQQQQDQQQDQQQQDQQQQDQQKLEDAMEQLEQTMEQLEQSIKEKQDELQQDPRDEQSRQELEELEQVQDQLQQLQDELQKRIDDLQPEAPDESPQQPQEPQDQDAEPEQGAEGQSTSQPREDTMTRDEAQRLLQAVRDKERLRRLEQIERERAGTPSTGKDW